MKTNKKELAHNYHYHLML